MSNTSLRVGGAALAQSIRAAELAGSIVGSCGAVVVIDLWTRGIPLAVPTLKSRAHAELLAHFAVSACCSSDIDQVQHYPVSYVVHVGSAPCDCWLFADSIV
jgi:hypothetical protein